MFSASYICVAPRNDFEWSNQFDVEVYSRRRIFASLTQHPHTLSERITALDDEQFLKTAAYFECVASVRLTAQAIT